MYQYKVKNVNDVVDGDTLDVTIDLGFDISFSSRVRLNGIDTPESRTTDLEEKKMGLYAKTWLKHTLISARNIIIETEKPDSTEKYGRILATLYINDDKTSVNDKMIELGIAWKYDGGTKHKDLDALRIIQANNAQEIYPVINNIPLNPTIIPIKK
jgi:micrococcal nuclease